MFSSHTLLNPALLKPLKSQGQGSNYGESEKEKEKINKLPCGWKYSL
jgi:hypothetical protein